MIEFGKIQPVAKIAIILSRVSSKEQEDGYSIDAQMFRSQQYCDRKNLSIVKRFEIIESSTKGERRDFTGMINFAKRQREPIAIVTDKIDRLQRSLQEYPLLNNLVLEGKIELHFVTENYIIHKHSAGQERIVWTMGVLMAQSYVESLRDNVIRGMVQKVREGGWIALAPLGYLNTRGERGRGEIIIDPDRAPLVRRLFETYATGAFTIGQMHQKSKEWGLRTHIRTRGYLVRSQIYKILNNPFYYGQMRIKGQLYPHHYEHLISQELFDKCQAVMKGWKKKPFLWASKEFVFRGLIKCALTGKMVTTDQKTKRKANGEISKWTYLRTASPDDPAKTLWIREEVVLKQVEEVLKGIYISPDMLKDMYAHINQMQMSEQEFHTRQMKELAAELNSIQTKKDKLTDLLIDDIIDRPEYDARKNSLLSRKKEIEGHILAHQIGDDGFNKSLCLLLDVISNAYNLFNSSTIEDKRRAVNFVFANLSLKGDKLLYSLREPMDHFVKCTDLSKWRTLIDTLRTDPVLRAAVIKCALCIGPDKDVGQ